MQTLHIHILCKPQPDSVVPALVHSPAGRDACTAAQTRSVLETAGITEMAAAYDERHGKNLRTSLGWRAVFARRRAPAALLLHVSTLVHADEGEPAICSSEDVREISQLKRSQSFREKNISGVIWR